MNEVEVCQQQRRKAELQKTEEWNVKSHRQVQQEVSWWLMWQGHADSKNRMKQFTIHEDELGWEENHGIQNTALKTVRGI